MLRKLLPLILLSACADDGAFDFSQVETNTSTVTIQREPNEDKPSDNDSDSGSGINPICASIKGIDGPSGFLWKPESDSDGKLVVLFPKEFTEQFKSVSVVDNLGNKELGKFSGFANGSRQHWRFSKPGGEYTGIITAESMNGECVWQVSNPSVRQD